MPPALFKLGVDGIESLYDVLDDVSSWHIERLVEVTDMSAGLLSKLVDILTSVSNSLRRLPLQSGVSTCSTVCRFSSSIT